jgi:hypothetical protein
MINDIISAVQKIIEEMEFKLSEQENIKMPFPDGTKLAKIEASNIVMRLRKSITNIFATIEALKSKSISLSEEMDRNLTEKTSLTSMIAKLRNQLELQKLVAEELAIELKSVKDEQNFERLEHAKDKNSVLLDNSNLIEENKNLLHAEQSNNKVITRQIERIKILEMKFNEMEVLWKTMFNESEAKNKVAQKEILAMKARELEHKRYKDFNEECIADLKADLNNVRSCLNCESLSKWTTHPCILTRRPCKPCMDLTIMT